MTHSVWFEIENIDELDTPALVVYPERVKQNIQSAIDLVGSPDRLRPHIKTHKTKEVVKLLMQAGVQQFKCATIAEAELLGICEAKDVLLAYQPLGPKLKRFIALIQHYPKTSFACLVDQVTIVKEMATAIPEQVNIRVFVDLNVGMNRTGIVPENAMDVIEECLNTDSLTLSGLHAYDGHLRNPDLFTRKQECDQAFERVVVLQQAVKEKHTIHLPVIAGGSPSFPIHAQRKDVVCSPGTFVYWDAGYASISPEQPFIHAALVVTRVISLPAPGIICTDLGHKSIAAENILDKRVVFLNAPELKTVSQSEEHLVLSTTENHTIQPGDILYGLPVHICPTCALYEKAIPVQDHRTGNDWRIIARDRKINI